MASYGHSCSQQAPQGHTSMASYGHLRLPFASSLAANRHPRATHPLKRSKPSKRLKRSKPLKTVKPVKRWLRVLRLAANSYPAPHINGFLWPLLQPTGTPGPHINGHSCSQQAPQGHTSMASYGHPSLPFASSLAANRHPRATPQWLLMGVQVCRLPALKPLKPSKPSKRLKRSKPFKPVKPVKRWLRVLRLAANSYPAPHINGFLWPFLQPTGTPRPHINGFLWASKSAVCQLSCSQQAPQGHTSMASYGRPSLPFARPKTLKTLQTLQTLKTLQTLQNRKTRTTLASRASSCSQQLPRATHQWLLMAILEANRHPRATHQWLLMGIQVCRLPALLQPTGTPGPHLNGFLWASKSAVCPP